MKNRREFYNMYFGTLAKSGYTVKKSDSEDYIADIYYKDRLVAFYTRNDMIVKNPYIEVKTSIMDDLNEKARSCALRADICVDRPYNDKTEKLPDGSYKLCEYDNYVMSCKQHHLFDYIFAVYRISPENNQKMQRQMFYSKQDALQNFSGRSGLVDERLLFSETELKIIHSNLIKMLVNFDSEMSADSINAVKALVDKVEDIVPELQEQNEFNFSQEFENDNDLEIGS